jgi:hypothetical protein
MKKLYLIDCVHSANCHLALYIACALYFDSICINGCSNNNAEIYGGGLNLIAQGLWRPCK